MDTLYVLLGVVGFVAVIALVGVIGLVGRAAQLDSRVELLTKWDNRRDGQTAEMWEAFRALGLEYKPPIADPRGTWVKKSD
jgi:hypothetical protein